MPKQDKNLTLTELMNILSNSNMSLSKERLNEITNGKTESQRAAIEKAAHIDITDAMAIESFVESAKACGWSPSFKQLGSGKGTSQQISIKFTPLNAQGEKIEGAKPFELKFSNDQNGHILINGIPSTNTLIAGINSKGDLTLTTAQSAQLRKMADMMMNAKNRASIGTNKDVQERLSMMRWIANTSRKETLSSGAAYKQNKEIEEMLDETLGIKGSNPSRNVTKLGDISANNLIKQIINRDLSLFMRHFNQKNSVYLTEDMKDRYKAKAETDLANILQLYAILGPKEADKYFKKDFGYLYNNAQMRKLISNVGTQINSMGISNAHLSDTNAMRFFGLNKPNVAGQDFFLSSQRKTMQTLLTHTPISLLKNNQKKRNVKGAIFTNTLRRNSNIDYSLGNYNLEGRAMVTEDAVKRGYRNFANYIINERNKNKKPNQKRYGKKDFIKEFGALPTTITEDALLYNKAMAREYDPYNEVTEAVNPQKVREYFEKKGWDFDKAISTGHSVGTKTVTVKGKKEKQLITAKEALTEAIKKVSSYTPGEGKDLKWNLRSIIEAIQDDDFFDVAYRAKHAIGSAKFVTPGATFREFATAIDPRLMAFIQREAGYKNSQIFEGLDGLSASDGKSFGKLLNQLSAGKIGLHANFASNLTSGSSVAGKSINVDAKSLGDYFTGVTNEVAYTFIDRGIEEAKKNGDTRSEKEIRAELSEKWIDLVARKVGEVAAD